MPATTTSAPPATTTTSTAASATTPWRRRPGTPATASSIHAGYGQDQILGFAEHGGGGTDIVDIQGFGLADFAALLPFMSQSGADTVITLNGADILTIRNVLPSELLATDFQFA